MSDTSGTSLPQAIDAIRRIVRTLHLAARRTELETGLSAAQLFVLLALAEREAASLTQLAERTMTDRTSAAAVVERLLERGYVTREASTEDQRRVAVRITPAGRAVLRRSPAPPTAVLLEGLAAMDAASLATLARLLTELTEHLGVAHEPAGMLFEDRLPRATRQGHLAERKGRRRT